MDPGYGFKVGSSYFLKIFDGVGGRIDASIPVEISLGHGLLSSGLLSWAEVIPNGLGSNADTAPQSATRSGPPGRLIRVTKIT